MHKPRFIFANCFVAEFLEQYSIGVYCNRKIAPTLLNSLHSVIYKFYTQLLDFESLLTALNNLDLLGVCNLFFAHSAALFIYFKGV